MSVLTMGRRVVMVGIVTVLAGVAGAAMAAPIVPPAAAVAHIGSSVVDVRVRVPRGILADVPTGGDPYFGSRPIFYPEPLVVVLAPPVFARPMFAPPVFGPPVFAPPVFAPPIFGWAPIDFGPCFVPTEHTSQFGYWGSCLESYLRQYYLNRPD